MLVSSEPRVFITGLGVVSPLGTGIDKFWASLKAAKSGIRRVDDRIDLTDINSKIGAAVTDFEPTDWLEPKRVRRLGRTIQLGLAAASQALTTAGLEPPPERCGVVVGTGVGDFGSFTENHRKMLEGGARKVSPFFIPQLMPNATPAQISIEYGFKGPNYGSVSACSSGTHAIGLAASEIRSGRADVMLAGGSEAPLIRVAYAGFDRLQALSTRNGDPGAASRPFDAQRDGFVIGEGAGVMLLESEPSLIARGAEPVAELVGFGATADAHHVTSPPEDGRGAREAMRLALEDGNLDPEEVDYINAHGTSTRLNDKVETKAIKDLFGLHARELVISSNKSQMGHLIGAAGGVEAVATCLSLEKGFIPPTINYRNPDPDCDLDYTPNQGRRQAIDVALSNSFGFGGQNGSLAFRSV